MAVPGVGRGPQGLPVPGRSGRRSITTEPTSFCHRLHGVRVTGHRETLAELVRTVSNTEWVLNKAERFRARGRVLPSPEPHSFLLCMECLPASDHLNVFIWQEGPQKKPDNTKKLEAHHCPWLTLLPGAPQPGQREVQINALRL